MSTTGTGSLRILIVSNLFAPDELAGASLYTDMASYFRARGHDVRVLTTFSYYPGWQLRSEDRGVSLRDEVLNDIPIRRVKMHVPSRPTGSGRMLSDISFLWSLWWRGRFSDWEPNIIVTALPMLSQCLVQRLSYWFRKIPRLIIVQDFAVEAALELGILRLPGLAWFLRGMQAWALKSAATITTISPLMLKKLEYEVCGSRRCVMIPNWIHGSLQTEIDRQRMADLARRATTLFYSGNLGVKQGLPDFLTQFDSARVAQSGWRLEISGGGAERQQILERTRGIDGVTLGSVLSEPDYVSRLLNATACLVTQKPGVGANFLPSKLLPALAAGTPVIAVCEETSPLAMEVKAGGFGFVVAPGSADHLRDCLMHLGKNPAVATELSDNAKRRAMLYHRDTVLKEFESEIRLLVRR
jgi:colanic acid biosynthesis glycosyl transferase WcaI